LYSVASSAAGSRPPPSAAAQSAPRRGRVVIPTDIHYPPSGFPIDRAAALRVEAQILQLEQELKEKRLTGKMLRGEGEDVSAISRAGEAQ
jgi:hypothetical protein